MSTSESETRTRSHAWLQSHGEPVALIEGQSGSVALWALTPANPLRYCATCDQRRRGAASDPRVCSHCRTAFPTPEVTR